MPGIENEVKIYAGSAPGGGPTPLGEPILYGFLDQVGKRLHAYFETYIKEDLKEVGPRPGDLWGMFRAPDDSALYIYVACIGVLWWVRKLMASLDDASLRHPLGRCGLVFATSRPSSETRSILVINGLHRTRHADIQLAVQQACSCLRQHLNLKPDEGKCEMLWAGLPPRHAPAP